MVIVWRAPAPSGGMSGRGVWSLPTPDRGAVGASKMLQHSGAQWSAAGNDKCALLTPCTKA